jgi:hypothetical protein
VRLHPDNAAKLFALVKKAGMANTTVRVRGGLLDLGGASADGRSKNRNGKKKHWFWDNRSN